MRLVADRTKAIVQSALVYRGQEYAFGTEPRPHGADASLSVNEVQLMVSGDDNQVLFVSGYCPYQGWRSAPLTLPRFGRAALLVADTELQSGTSIQLKWRGGRWPVRVDVESGWVCLGDAESTSEGVEFAPGCVAVIHDDQLVALWLRPREMPRAVMLRMPS